MAWLAVLSAAVADLGAGCAVSVAVVCLLTVYWWRRPCANFPPGPRGVPLLGVTPFLGAFPAVTFKKWSLEKYGPVMSVRMGPNDVVVLNTFEAVNQALVKQSASFSDRPWMELFRSTGHDGLGMKKYDDDFKIQKHFGLKFLRGKGVGKRSMDDMINAEADQFLDFLQTFEGESVDMKKYFYWLTSNVVSQVALGKRFDYGDPAYHELLNAVSNLVRQEDASKLALISLFGFLGKVPPISGAQKSFDRQQSIILRHMQKYIDEHKKRFDPDNIDDFIDAFLFEAKHGTGNSGSFTDKQLRAYCRDLFAAGTETSSSSLAWCIAFLLNYPEYYKIIQAEIDDSLGTAGKPSMSMRGQTPMTCALIQEMFRCRTLAPLALPHSTIHDTKLMGYKIPKGTQVIPNLHGVHMDPETWPEPHVFDPRRHIDDDGKFVPSAKIIPFAVGARFCVGESLARNEIYVFLVRVLQRFGIRPASGVPPSVDDYVMSATLSIKECEVFLTPRG